MRVCSLTLPLACAHTPYWTPMMESEPGEGHLLLLIKVLKAALRLEAACNTAGCNAVLVKVFKECLPDPKFRFYFLAVVWGWQSSLPFTDIIDEALQAWTLVLGKALLSPSGTQSSSLAWTLGTHQPLVPSLLSALTSGEKGVRKGAIECLRALAGVRGGALAADSYVEVIRIVLNQAEELLDDASQLAELFGGGGSSVGRKQATQSVLGVVVGGEGLLPPHVCAALLYSLTAANDTAILLQLLPLAESLLEKAEKTVQGREEQRNEEEGKLDVPSSLCLLYILQRYTPEAAEVLETKAGLRVFERAMESARPCLLLHDGVMAPQSVLLQEVLSSRFMASLKSEATASRLWTLLVSRVTSSRDPQEAGRLRHALRHVTLDAEVIMRQIDDLELTPKVTSLQAAKFKRMKMREPSVAHQQSWEKLQLMLETLTIMKDLQRPWLLVAPLTHWLNMTLTLDLTSTTLLQQQILSTLLHLLEKCVEELSEEEVSQRVQVNVEVIVACVRASLSHDTHRRALLILALCARIVPDAVLHNMMAIFTFMGTSLLRRDDAYSFEVIHHTIQSIVPTLIQHQGENKTLAKGAAVDDRLAQVCQVFVDALPDLPHHRRLPLLTQLATTLQPNPNLWLLLALLANSHVMKGGTRGYKGVGQEGKGDERVRVEEEEEEEERGTLPQVIQFSLTLASQFPATTQVLACVRLMQLVSTLPDDKETSKALQQHQQQRQQDSLLQLREQKSQGKKKGSNEMQKKSQEHHQENKDGNEEENLDFKKVNEAQLISRTISHSPRHTFHLKYTVTGLVAHLLASDKFIGKVYDAEEEDLEVKELQSLCHQLLEVTLCLLHNVNFACDLHKDKSAGRFFTSLQRKVVEVVERLVALLPPSSLLQVCQGLLSSPVALVRCRAAELISAKLQPHLNYFRSEDTRELQNTLQTLCRGVANKQEPVDNRQTFLYCLLMLTRLLSNRTASLPSLPPLPTPSLQLVLDTAVSVLCDESEEPWVVTQGLLVAAEAVAALQAAAVGCLGRLMPTLIKTLAASATTADAASTANTASDMAAAAPAPAATTQLLATLTALHKVIDSLPQFLSPYIEEVTKQVCCIRPLEGATKTAAVGKESKVMAKLLAIRESLIKKVEPRILVPRLVKAFHSLLGAGALADLHNLVAMVGCLVGELGPKKLPQHIPALLGLLTNALDLRSLKGDGQEVEPVEEAIFSAISRLLLHLPEQDNISIFTSIITWATSSTTPAETPTAPARLISLYRFVSGGYMTSVFT
ncbi:HEAT repeat-containing protein 1-like [Eriocheir sinensis]|uniref:HEAT repeat-containing protein 1-like n=1 Tax=Eriocheir sinensis TaxID=95602 RepID=UPI0021C66F70|nr:HEAT repeat-containing protein 1-like [Eriocheir sinensis]